MKYFGIDNDTSLNTNNSRKVLLKLRKRLS